MGTTCCRAKKGKAAEAPAEMADEAEVDAAIAEDDAAAEEEAAEEKPAAKVGP